LKELGVDKQIHDLVTSKVIVQPTAAPKPGKLPVSREEAITQLKACLAPLCLPSPSGGNRWIVDPLASRDTLEELGLIGEDVGGIETG